MAEDNQEPHVLTTPVATYTFDARGVLHIVSSGIEVDDSILESNFHAVKNFLGGQKTKMFADVTRSTPFDKRYRLAFEKQANELCLALAMTSESVLGTAVANIFIAMSRSKVPMKMFNRKDQALKWLDQF